MKPEVTVLQTVGFDYLHNPACRTMIVTVATVIFSMYLHYLELTSHVQILQNSWSERCDLRLCKISPRRVSSK